MKNDKAFLTAMKIVGMRGDTEAYRDAVLAIARAIRAAAREQKEKDAQFAADFPTSENTNIPQRIADAIRRT